MSNLIYAPNLAAGPELFDLTALPTLRPVTHPGLLFIPDQVETLPDGQPGLTGDILMPPPSVVASIYAKTWLVTCEIEANGLSISASSDPVSIGATTWTGRLTNAAGGSFSETEFGSGSDFLSVGISIGNLSVPPRWSWSEGAWWPSVVVYIQTVQSDPETFVSGESDGGIGAALAYDLAEEMEVGFTICGQEIPLYYVNRDPAYEITGTISLVSSEWLAPW